MSGALQGSPGPPPDGVSSLTAGISCAVMARQGPVSCRDAKLPSEEWKAQPSFLPICRPFLLVGLVLHWR